MGEAKRRKAAQWLPLAQNPTRQKPGWWQPPQRTIKEFIIDMVRCLEERAVRCEMLAQRRYCSPQRRAKLLRRHWVCKDDLKAWKTYLEGLHDAR